MRRSAAAAQCSPGCRGAYRPECVADRPGRPSRTRAGFAPLCLPCRRRLRYRRGPRSGRTDRSSRTPENLRSLTCILPAIELICGCHHRYVMVTTSATEASTIASTYPPTMEVKSTMLMRTDPFRELDRLTQQFFGTAARPAFMPMDAWREEDTFHIEFA